VRGVIGVDIAELTKAIEGWKGRLNAKVMGKADVSRGRRVFKKLLAPVINCFYKTSLLDPTSPDQIELIWVMH